MNANEARRISEQNDIVVIDDEMSIIYAEIEEAARSSKREIRVSDRGMRTLGSRKARFAIMAELTRGGYACRYDVDDGLDGPNMSGDDSLVIGW